MRSDETVEASRSLDAEILAVQRDPKSPELGATRLEARAVCEHQRGLWTDQGEKVGCQLRRENLFACELDSTSIVSGCTYWKVGADVAEERNAFFDTRGKPTSSTVDPRGFRSFSWETPNDLLTVSGYSAGVVVTYRKADASSTEAQSPP